MEIAICRKRGLDCTLRIRGLAMSAATNLPLRRSAIVAPATASVSAMTRRTPSSWKRSAMPVPMPRAGPDHERDLAS